MIHVFNFSSPAYQRFVNVMCDMTGDERKVSIMKPQTITLEQTVVGSNLSLLKKKKKTEL